MARNIHIKNRSEPRYEENRQLNKPTGWREMEIETISISNLGWRLKNIL